MVVFTVNKVYKVYVVSERAKYFTLYTTSCGIWNKMSNFLSVVENITNLLYHTNKVKWKIVIAQAAMDLWL